MAHLLGLHLRTLQLLHARRAQLHQLPPRLLPAGHMYTQISGHMYTLISGHMYTLTSGHIERSMRTLDMW